MIISHSKKFIFFSFPKTGSESVRELLSSYNEEPVLHFRQTNEAKPFYSHMTLAETDVVFAKRGLNIADYYTFTFVRNPYARLVSIYEMAMSVGKVNRVLRMLGAPKPSFHEWLEHTKPYGRGGGGKPSSKWRQYGTWSIENWIKNQEGDPAMDGILRLEHITTELPVIFDKIGVDLPKEIIHKNRRVSADYRTYYDDITKQIVKDRYAYDLEKFGYEF